LDAFLFSSSSLSVVNDRRAVILRNNDADDDHNNANTFKFPLSIPMSVNTVFTCRANKGIRVRAWFFATASSQMSEADTRIQTSRSLNGRSRIIYVAFKIPFAKSFVWYRFENTLLYRRFISTFCCPFGPLPLLKRVGSPIYSRIDQLWQRTCQTLVLPSTFWLGRFTRDTRSSLLQNDRSKDAMMEIIESAFMDSQI